MACIEPQWDGHSDYLEHLRNKVFRERVPLYVSFELTRRCNLDCLHCYLGVRAGRESSEELDTREFLSVIDQTADLGCLFLLLTGGDPLLRRDFDRLYERAKLKGMIVTVFTNGTTVTERIADLFADLPPQAVEISVYGASADVYRAVTGHAQAFEQCRRGIERLLERGIRVKLKAMLMESTLHEAGQIQKLAESYSVPFIFDPILRPTLSGDHSPLAWRLSPDAIIEREMGTEERRKAWREFLARANWAIAPDRLYNCAAGHNTFHITPDGLMHPCLMARDVVYNVRAGDLKTGWNLAMPRLREQKMPASLPCNSCHARVLCSYCPPAFQAEGGEYPPAFYCQLSNKRLQILTSERQE